MIRILLKEIISYVIQCIEFLHHAQCLLAMVCNKLSEHSNFPSDKTYLFDTKSELDSYLKGVTVHATLMKLLKVNLKIAHAYLSSVVVF